VNLRMYLNVSLWSWGCTSM